MSYLYLLAQDGFRYDIENDPDAQALGRIIDAGILCVFGFFLLFAILLAVIAFFLWKIYSKKNKDDSDNQQG